MEGAVRKAAVLIEALSWIRQFRGRYVVIKLGGSALEEEAAVKSFLTDVIFMRTVGMHPILVHGGGKAISKAMNAAGIEARFVHGRRYTDEKTLEIASSVLANQISESLADEIRGQGAKAEPLHFGTRNCLFGEQLTLKSEDGSRIDLGHVGSVTDVDQKLLAEICESDAIPVIPSVALDENGQKLNVNADTAAAALARILKAEKLVFLSDVPGIYQDKDDPQTLLSHLETERCRALIADGTIDAGMVPKVDAALEALSSGVKKVHIVDARLPHSILLEIYSDKGIGTEIVK
ncbi:MAG: acetylglutamate kinase [Planctomycetes bacterium]|nr:acetylglutamate kinase [Planctomycetota bacterium]MCH9726692.1 acetylglutamate kinase [Planctomycetota bacterium]MCH9779600.1 acetylglutamate kinase [Planctomycetota bacterium]MDF1742617.1 acetylglutamate kinase [Gimesia sp.]